MVLEEWTSNKWGLNERNHPVDDRLEDFIFDGGNLIEEFRFIAVCVFWGPTKCANEYDKYVLGWSWGFFAGCL